MIDSCWPVCLVEEVGCHHREVYGRAALPCLANSRGWPIVDQGKVSVRDCVCQVQTTRMSSSSILQSVADVEIASHIPTARLRVEGFEPSNLSDLAAPSRVVNIDQGGLSVTFLCRYTDGTGSEPAAYWASWGDKGTVCQPGAVFGHLRPVSLEDSSTRPAGGVPLSARSGTEASTRPPASGSACSPDGKGPSL